MTELEIGLVDIIKTGILKSGLLIPAIINGKKVYLCWKSDQQSIIYYPDNHAGFSGRKPFPK